ncbi:MAG: response regulator [Armatimonadetes bacterium]|nr:response regulator [Armatimonadota bacterium]
MKRILIVEDDDLSGELMREALSGRELEVMVVKTGAEALELAQRERYHLIVTDIRLPDSNGIELARRIRFHGCSTSSAIFAVSGMPLEDEEVRIFNELFTKPVSLAHFRDRVLRWLQPSNKEDRP